MLMCMEAQGWVRYFSRKKIKEHRDIWLTIVCLILKKPKKKLREFVEVG